MQRFVPYLFALTGASSLAACGDDPVKPGSILAHWTQGPTSATCGTRGITTLEARALKGEEVIGSATATCPADATNGDIAIDDVDPGSYTVQVEGKNAAGKGIYLASATKVSVKEGKATTTADLPLAQKPAALSVDWNVPGGGTCAKAGLDQIEVSLYYNADEEGDLVGDPQKVDCDTIAVDFSDLDPNEVVQLIAYGYDAAKKKVAKGVTEFFPLTAGDDLTKTIQLEKCPGEPPVCP